MKNYILEQPWARTFASFSFKSVNPLTIFLNNQRLSFSNFFFNITLAKVWVLNQVEINTPYVMLAPQKVSNIKISKCAEHQVFFSYVNIYLMEGVVFYASRL